MKREFDLEDITLRGYKTVGSISIMISQDEPPFVCIDIEENSKNYYMRDKDLELFAVNILKSLNSKRVLQGKVPYYKRKKLNNKK